MDTQTISESQLDREIWLESRKSVMGAGMVTDIERDIFTQAYASVGGFDLGAYRKSISSYAKMRTGFEKQLKSLIANFDAGRLSRSATIAQFRTIATETYRGAFRLGAMRAGNPFYKDIGLTAVDRKFGLMARQTEERYFSRFLDQLSAKKSRLAPSVRAGNYAKSLDAQYWNGFTVGTGTAFLIHWEMGMPFGPHCGDCEDIAARSPYTSKTLPTVPRAGDTACRHNCYCTLVSVKPGRGVEAPGGFDGLGATGPGISRTGLEASACLVQTRTGQAVSGGVHKMFDDLYAQMYTLRAKVALSAGEEQAIFIAQRKLVNAELIKLAKSYNVRVIPRYSVKEVIKIAESLKAKGLDLVKGIWLCPF